LVKLENLVKNIIKIGSMGFIITGVLMLGLVFNIKVPTVFDGITTITTTSITTLFVVVFVLSLIGILIILYYVKYLRTIEVEEIETEE